MERRNELPERLLQRTIETMQPDVPYVVSPESFTSLKETVWVDTSNPEQWSLAIDKDENVKTLIPEYYEIDDLLVVMRVYIVDKSGELIEGVVADVRSCNVQFDGYDTQKAVEETDDTEELWGRLSANDRKVRILTIVDEGEETGEIEFYGNPNFYGAAEYLAQQVDDIFAENFQDTAKKTDSTSSKKSKEKIKK